mmetsp:Transcript_5440/g.13621  ORF Transcript_5440/g.13621 Transcript_5440/m.13621 type:complete len:224 (-) Transcript_5440:489-1160(-)
MSEEYGLSRTLLATACIGILIALPGNIVNIVDVRSQYLPIEPRIFDFHPAPSLQQQMLRDSRASSELRQPHISIQYQLFCHRPLAIQQIYILPVHTAIVQKVQKLLHHQRALLRGFQHRLVPHEERSHQLQDGDLQWEIERRYDGHGTERPAVPVAELAVVIAGDSERSGEEPYVVPPEIFEEVCSHLDLSHGLGVRLRYGLLDGFGEEVGDDGIAQRFSCLP